MTNDELLAYYAFAGARYAQLQGVEIDYGQIVNNFNVCFNERYVAEYSVLALAVPATYNSRFTSNSLL